MSGPDIRSALDRARARRGELSADVAAAAQALQAAQGALKDGGGSAQSVTAAHAEHAALSGALGSLDADIQGLEAQAAQAQRKAARDAELRHLAQLAQNAKAALERYGTDMAEANELLGPFIERMTAAMAERYRCRREFIEALGDLSGGGVKRSQRPTDVGSGPRYERFYERRDAAAKVLSELEAMGVDLNPVLNSAFIVDEHEMTMFDRPLGIRAPEPFGRAISGLCNQAAGERLFPQSIHG